MGQDVTSLLQPVSADAVCGVDLEYTQLLAAIDAYRLFGSDIPLAADTDWRAVRDRTLEALGQSHDLRVLAHLAAAIVRIDGLIAFCSVITIADRWVSEHWDEVFPRIDEDAVLRTHALHSFADRMAIVDAVRRTPVLSHRQLGAFSLRDLELAMGQLTPADADSKAPNLAQIEATLANTPPNELVQLSGALQAGMGSLRNIVATMQTRSGFESAPDLDGLLRPLSRIDKLLTEHIPGTAANEPSAASAGNEDNPAMATGPVTDIKSRQDAIRALDAVSAYFRSHEPSSPVPMLLERAKRLVSKSFMEVLADIAPDSLSQARLIGGIQNDEGQ
ncbi:MAG: type secretion system protein ImpA [Gammaproteobacteria bacterium]|jgi:type VI secretion system protein ImpA|nr:type secretion system protein ImpA [Gammaproteobacteria bacterium]